MSERLISLPFDVPLLPVIELIAGDINCLYEHGNLRYVRLGDKEIVRMIYTAVRDANWETALYEISNEEIRRDERSFEIRYTAIYQLNDIHYKSYVSIEGRADSSIFFRIKGEALSTFEKNRIGLCLLHPIGACANKNVTITRPDTTTYNGVFPEYISPYQPFKQVHKMEWNDGENNLIQLIFEGDVFETEDQRNWTDNSYKTYSTPLEFAAPVKVSKGEMMEQTISLKIIEGTNSLERTTAADHRTVGKIPFPKIGYSCGSGSKPLTKNELTLLKNMLPDHYRATLVMSSHKWKEELTLAGSEAKTLNASVELVVFFTDRFEEEVVALIEQMKSLEANVESILPLHTAHKTTPVFLLEHLYLKIKNVFPALSVGYGTDAFFADLNRNRPGEVEYDFVSFSMYPQVHATDTRTIIENLESMPYIIKSIQQFTSRPIHISPITFSQRSNLHYTNNEPYEEINKGNVELRLHTWFGAAWTLMVLKNLCSARQLTFYQITGNEGCGISTFNDEARSPMYETLLQLKEFDPIYVITGQEQGKVIFENNKGELLSYTIDERFYSYHKNL